MASILSRYQCVKVQLQRPKVQRFYPIAQRFLLQRLVHYIDDKKWPQWRQITSLTVVYSTVHSDADQRKHQSSSSLVFVWGIHRDRWIPRTKASYAENVSSWWRHHVICKHDMFYKTNCGTICNEAWQSDNFIKWLPNIYIHSNLLARPSFELERLWPREAIWKQRYGSTLVQLMACCLNTPSHFLI